MCLCVVSIIIFVTIREPIFQFFEVIKRSVHIDNDDDACHFSIDVSSDICQLNFVDRFFSDFYELSLTHSKLQS
jgi:hypothetical protein